MDVLQMESAYSQWKRGDISRVGYWARITDTDEFWDMLHLCESFGVELARTEKIMLFNRLYVINAVDDIETFILNQLITWGY